MARIPRHFHFVFGLKPQEEPFHLIFYLCLESCIQVNKPDRITLYYHYEIHGVWWERIRDRLELVQVSLSSQIGKNSYDSDLIRSFRYAHHADFVRLEKLCEHGGVYADIDTLFINPLPDALFEKCCVLGREKTISYRDERPDEASLCNALIMGEPNSAFLRRWLEHMPATFDGSWSAHSCQLPNRLSLQYPEEIHIEPERSFYPYMWTEEDLGMLLEERHDDWGDVFSLHLWNHLWWSTERLDFSAMSGDRFTERFIRKGSNTYSLAARRFLPPECSRSRLRQIVAYVGDILGEYWARRYELAHELKRWKRRGKKSD